MRNKTKKIPLFIAGLALAFVWALTSAIEKIFGFISRIAHRGLEYIYKKWD